MLFRQEVIEGQSQSGMGDVIISQPRIFAVMTTAFVVIAFVFAGIAAYGTYSRKETVPGYLAPQNGVAPIFAQRGGIVTEIFVAEGDRVVAGDPIVRLSLDSANAEDDASLAAQIARVDARIREARLQLEARSQLFGGEEAELALRIEGLEADLDQLSRSADLARESAALAERQWERWQSLSERGLAPNAEVERVRNSLINAQGVLQDIARQRLERERQLSEVRHQVTQLPTRRDLELSRARDSVTALEQARRDLERAAGYTIPAPIAGRVTSVQASIGLAVRPELPLAALVPEGEVLRAHLLVPTSAAGFVEPGQAVRLRIDAFNYQRFGTVEGHVADLSTSALSPSELAAPISVQAPVYRLSVDLARQSVSAYGSSQPLQPGMTLSADVIVDERPLWRWVMDPVLAVRN